MVGGASAGVEMELDTPKGRNVVRLGLAGVVRVVRWCRGGTRHSQGGGALRGCDWLGFHAGVRRSGIGGADGKHGLYEYMHTQVAYIQS